jgi:hypothetical protein
MALDLDEVLAQMAPQSQAQFAVEAAKEPALAAVTQPSGTTPAPEAPQEGDITVTARPKPAPAPAAPAPATQDEATAQAKSSMFDTLPLELSERTAAVQSQASAAGDVLDSVSQGLKANADDQIALAGRTVQAVKSINDSVNADANAAIATSRPLWAKRAAVAERRGEIRNMNPIVRGIKGIFDRNYDDDYLKGQEADLDDQLGVSRQQFNDLGNYQNSLLAHTQSTASAEDQLLTVKKEGLNQDLNMALTSLTFARGRFSDTIATMGANSELIKGQGIMRDSVLSQTDGATLSAGIAAAQKSPDGMALIGGVKISASELRERSRQLEQQQLALTSARQNVVSGGLQIKSQQIALNRAQEGQLLDNMSLADVRQAAANGGKFKGVQLDMVEVTRRAANLDEGLTAMAKIGSPQQLMKQTEQTIRQYGATAVGFAQNTDTMFGRGNRPKEATYALHTMNGLVNEVAALAKGNDPLKEQKIRVLQDRMVTESGKIDKLIDGYASRMSTNPDARIAITAQIKGVPLTAEQSAKSLIAFAEGDGLPPGVRLGGIEGNAIKASSQALNQLSQNPTFQKADAATKQRMKMEVVAKAGGRVWLSGNMSRITNAMPQLARSMGDPVGNIPDSVWQSTQAAGDAAGVAAGAKAFAKQYGVNITADEFKQLAGGNTGTIRKVQLEMGKDKQMPSSEFLSQQLATMQTQNWMAILDQQVGAGTARSVARFMGDPRVQSHIGQFSDSLSDQNLGTRLVDGMAAGGLRNNFANASQSIIGAVNANEAAGIQATRERMVGYHDNPYTRAATIFGAMGLDQHSAQLLASEVEKRQAEVGYNQPNFSSSRNDAMDAAILDTKYQDPKLEAVRKRAAKDWVVTRDIMDRGMKHLATGGR